MGAAMRISCWRLVLVIAAAVSLTGYPKLSRAMTVDVTVSPNRAFTFSPSSVTIRPGDTVRWTWNDDFHSSTSGTPGMPNGLWNSGVLNQGAVFTHTFNSMGTFQYYCTPHGACCHMVGTVSVVNSSQTPTPTPTPTPTSTSILANISTRSFVQTDDNVMIGGFIVQGTQPKTVIIRAIGPELTPFGVPDVLANPTLELHDGAGALIGFNDDWQNTVIGGVITH